MKLLLATVAALVTTAPAQQGPQDLQEHLALLRQKLQSRQADEQHLLDLLARHNLGFSVRGDHWFMLPVEDTGVPPDQAREQLRQYEAEIARLADRLDQLRTQQNLYPQTYQVATELPGSESPPAVPLFDLGPVEPRTAEPPVAETPAAEPPVAETPPLEQSSTEGGATLIVGSTNRSAIAGSLYNVAAALMRDSKRLREWGRDEEARGLDEKARRRLELALRELETLVAGEEPAFVDLFYQGKCLEGLFYLDTLYGDLMSSGKSPDYARRFEAMRQPFLSIMARDVDPDGQTLGSWGQSAQTALRVIRWMGDFGNYEPAVPIDSIRWNRK